MDNGDFMVVCYVVLVVVMTVFHLANGVRSIYNGSERFRCNNAESRVIDYQSDVSIILLYQ